MTHLYPADRKLECQCKVGHATSKRTVQIEGCIGRVSPTSFNEQRQATYSPSGCTSSGRSRDICRSVPDSACMAVDLLRTMRMSHCNARCAGRQCRRTGVGGPSAGRGRPRCCAREHRPTFRYWVSRKARTLDRRLTKRSCRLRRGNRSTANPRSLERFRADPEATHIVVLLTPEEVERGDLKVGPELWRASVSSITEKRRRRTWQRLYGASKPLEMSSTRKWSELSGAT
jgi:hypothetical protein